MSLTDIRAMRLSHQKPSGVVSVVIGKVSQERRADPLLIEVAPGSNPSLMDWRPLVGVWVQVLHIAGDWSMTDQVVEAVSKAGGKMFGFVCAGCVYPLAIFENPDDTQRATVLLHQEWGALCN